MTWHAAYAAVQPFIVKIETQQGFGTGFVFAVNQAKSFAAVATALHVVDQAHTWRLPMKLRQHNTGTDIFLAHDERAVLVDYKRDSAAILVPYRHLTLPEAFLPLFPRDKMLRVGVPVGWVGYPAIAPTQLCFFQGSISAFNFDDDSYFIDGVAINGVSGGPVFEETADGALELVGLVSAYFANVQQRGTLPGLLKAHDVTHLHTMIETMKSVAEARESSQNAEGSRDNTQEPSSSPVPNEAGGPSTT